MTMQRAPDRGRWKMLAVLAVCAAPVLASYFTYYVIKPTTHNNYGTLVDPRSHPIPPLSSTTLDGRPEGLDKYKGKWIMLKVGGGECAQACQKQLFTMRQERLMQGKEMDRIERVWLVTDREPLETILIREYDGMHMLHADPAAVAKWLPVDPGTKAEDHIYLIDPLGNLMMRFPADPDPRKMYKDVNKLLKASSIG
jgi:cytochrome oxidase Cu insertion factor (SCO1/SenC/PrrC family)